VLDRIWDFIQNVWFGTNSRFRKWIFYSTIFPVIFVIVALKTGPFVSNYVIPIAVGINVIATIAILWHHLNWVNGGHLQSPVGPLGLAAFLQIPQVRKYLLPALGWPLIIQVMLAAYLRLVPIREEQELAMWLVLATLLTLLSVAVGFKWGRRIAVTAMVVMSVWIAVAHYIHNRQVDAKSGSGNPTPPAASTPVVVAYAPLGVEPAQVRSRHSGPYDVEVAENSKEWIHFTYKDRDGNTGHRQWRRDETRGLRWFDKDDHQCSKDSPCSMTVVWSDKESRWLQHDKEGEDIWVESRPVAEAKL